MKEKCKTLTRARVIKLFTYDPEKGELYRRDSTGCSGKLVGRLVQIAGIKYVTSRVIWLYMTGKWPKVFIDHKNRNKYDNCWNNLREATASQNGVNVVWHTVGNRFGYRGVNQQVVKRGRINRRYYARVKVERQYIYLGSFDTPAEAARAYDAGAVKYFGDFALLNFPKKCEYG